MLDGIDADRATNGRAAPKSRPSWHLPLLLGLIVAGALWWWNRDDESSSRLEPVLRVEAQSPQVQVASVEAAASGAAAATSPAAALSASGAARIERSREAERTAVPSLAAMLSSPAASSVASTPTTTGTSLRLATAAARPLAVSPAMPTTPATTALAAARPRGAETRRVDAPAASGDPDVTLLSAMLARLSGDDRSAVETPRPTIAQLVERCEARTPKDSIEAFDCKRRICAGYWGRADACPLSLAPK